MEKYVPVINITTFGDRGIVFGDVWRINGLDDFCAQAEISFGIRGKIASGIFGISRELFCKGFFGTLELFVGDKIKRSLVLVAYLDFFLRDRQYDEGFVFFMLQKGLGGGLGGLFLGRC